MLLRWIEYLKYTLMNKRKRMRGLNSVDKLKDRNKPLIEWEFQSMLYCSHSFFGSLLHLSWVKKKNQITKRFAWVKWLISFEKVCLSSGFAADDVAVSIMCHCAVYVCACYSINICTNNKSGHWSCNPGVYAIF